MHCHWLLVCCAAAAVLLVYGGPQGGLAAPQAPIWERDWWSRKRERHSDSAPGATEKPKPEGCSDLIYRTQRLLCYSSEKHFARVESSQNVAFDTQVIGVLQNRGSNHADYSVSRNTLTNFFNKL